MNRLSVKIICSWNNRIIMASSRVVSFEMESRQNDPDDNEHEIQTLRFKNELKHSLDDDDEDTTSSIVSDYTGDGATKHFDSKFNFFFL